MVRIISEPPFKTPHGIHGVCHATKVNIMKSFTRVQDRETLNGVSDLQQYGINALTGEACPFSLRMLCDLSEEGKVLIEEIFGMECNRANMNSKVGNKDAIASVMIPHSAFVEIKKYILWRIGSQYIVTSSNDWNMQGYKDFTEDEKEYYFSDDNDGHKVYMNPRVKGQPAVGGMNVHAFTGRTK